MFRNVVLLIRVLAAFLLSFCHAAIARGDDKLDVITLGDATSERSHDFGQTRSEVIRGGLDESARRLLPLDPPTYNGGSIRFTLHVDPARQNYLTVKLFGSDRGSQHGRLILYADDLQVGYRHQGDIDVLNQMDDEASYQGRWLYETVPLPLMLTRGKTKLPLKIAALGAEYPYGRNFAELQHTLSVPTRGIYRVYTHLSAKFEPDAAEKQGAPITPVVRPRVSGEPILAQMKATVDRVLNGLFDVKAAHNANAERRMLLLAVAYDTPWTVAYHNDRAIAAIVREGDAYLTYGMNDVDAGHWAGAGRFGEAVARIGRNRALDKALDEPIEAPKGAGLPGKTMTRRAVWAHALRASIDEHRLHGRRYYTNQAMIVDFGIYSANRGLRVLEPNQAMPEPAALRYVYEAIGLKPWLGDDKPGGGSDKPYGERYFQITDKGLSRELGYVGIYGETILKFCRDVADVSGDEAVMKQLVKIQTARMAFRYPSQDPEGYRQMKLASEIDNRTAHFPLSNGAYNGANVNELWWMEVPALTKDPVSVGAAQQSLEDNQYFFRLAQRAKDPDLLGMMLNIGEYATVRALPKSAYRLPMSDGQPDFVFSDEENAVLALKHGDQRLFVNFYYRQEYGVSGIARILDVTPATMRIATVYSQFEVNGTGEEWTRPDVIDFERSGGFPPPAEAIHQAFKGEKNPIAKRPDDAREPRYGSWGPFVGKAAFYWLRYGDYLIGVNTTDAQSYTLPAPAGYDSARDLVSGKTVDLQHGFEVRPRTTVVFVLGK